MTSVFIFSARMHDGEGTKYHSVHRQSSRNSSLIIPLLAGVASGMLFMLLLTLGYKVGLDAFIRPANLSNESAADYGFTNVAAHISERGIAAKPSADAQSWMKKYPAYAYGGSLYAWRHIEFPNLGANSTYLDFTGSGLFQVSQLKESLKFLESALFCNIHSDSACSRNSEKAVDDIRDMILEFFNAPRGTYSVIFTSGASAGLQLIAHSFPWSNKSHFMYSKHNHNSVLGMRRVALKHGANFGTFPFDLYKMSLEEEFVRLCNTSYLKLAKGSGDAPDTGKIHRPTARDIAFHKEVDSVYRNKTHHLIAFPAEDNFSGVKYNLDLIHAFQSGDFAAKFMNTTNMCTSKNSVWHVLLDAAAFVPTNPLDLDKYPASFVVVSFYKMFGYPSGVGALLVRNDINPLLQKTFFGGGAVVLASCESDYCKLKPSYHERFEDGTLNFLHIPSLRYGFNILKTLGMENIQAHVWAVTRRAYEGLTALKHHNGLPLVEVYGEHARNDMAMQGGIVAFNLKDVDGNYLGYYGFSRHAAEHGFMLRVGCNCNPGACNTYVGISEEDVIEASENKTSCGDELDMVKGIPLGAIRLSLGYITTIEDVDRFVDFVKHYYTNRRGSYEDLQTK